MKSALLGLERPLGVNTEWYTEGLANGMFWYRVHPLRTRGDIDAACDRGTTAHAWKYIIGRVRGGPAGGPTKAAAQKTGTNDNAISAAIFFIRFPRTWGCPPRGRMGPAAQPRAGVLFGPRRFPDTQDPHLGTNETRTNEYPRAFAGRNPSRAQRGSDART